MTPEQLQQMMKLLRENLVQAGIVSYVIEDEPLRLLARFIDETRLSLRPPMVAIAYTAIVWATTEGKLEA